MKRKIILLIAGLGIIQIVSGQSPYYHKVYRAASTDGLNFTKDTTLLFTPASVPGAVKDTNNTIFIYYAYMPTPTSPETLMVASSTDGKNFTTPQPINLTNNVSLKQVDPNPVLLADGRIRLYYLDFGTLPPTNIYSAVSNDGINFSEESGIRFSQPSPGITDPDVFLVGSTWVMFVSQGQTLIRATSTDGLNFTEDVTFSWNNGGVCSTFPFPGGIYRTYYCGTGGIQSATSTDGKNLTVESGVRLNPNMSEIVCDPTLVELTSGNYIMYYKTVSITADIEDIDEKKEKFQLYPNPFNTTITIVIPSPDGKIGMNSARNLSLRIYDVIGKIVFEKTSTSKLETLNLDLPNGIYFLQVISDNFIQTKKLEVIK